MKTSLTVAAAATLVILTSAANAQLADKRSFFHPLGVWSNEGFVAQRQVYPPRWKFERTAQAYYADPDLQWNSNGGGVLHERNW